MGMDVGSSTKGRVAPQMNVTPLVDVVLVLLIIFMVVTPLLTKKFWLHVPKKEEATAEPPPDNDQRQIVLSVAKDGSIKINSQVVAREDLDSKLKRALAARGDGLVFFDAESEAEYGRAVDAMDIARAAGASSIAVLTQQLGP